MIVSMFPLVRLGEERIVAVGEVTVHSRFGGLAVDFFVVVVGRVGVGLRGAVGFLAVEDVGDSVVVVEIEGWGDGRGGGGDGEMLVGAGVAVCDGVRVWLHAVEERRGEIAATGDG